MNAKTINENYEQAAKSLLEEVAGRNNQMIGIPFSHQAQCDVCQKWVNYNDRMLFRDEKDKKEIATCFWCAMHPKFEWSPNHNQAMRMIKQILQQTIPNPDYSPKSD